MILYLEVDKRKNPSFAVSQKHLMILNVSPSLLGEGAGDEVIKHRIIS